MMKWKLFIIVVLLVHIAFMTTGFAQEKQKTSKPANKTAFTGVVVRVDVAVKIITIKGGGRQINFDMTNPVLKGYKQITDVKAGDTVSVMYTTDGIKIAKGAVQVKPPERKVEVLKPKKTAPVRVKEKVKGTSFKDVDENEDGKVSPVELSVIIKNLTIKQFKEYDKNNDGYLDKSEFDTIWQGK
jgi:type II secretory pathway component PulC